MMRAGLLTLVLGGCAWVTPAELDAWREDCTCSDGATTYYPDRDDDDWGAADGRVRCTPHEGWVETAGDCDDGDAGIHPGAQEVCDGLDDDCDGETDEHGAAGEARWYEDADGDGWGDEDTWLTACTAPSGYVSELYLDDCDDGDAGVHPGAEEVCDNGVDDDCDGGAGECRLDGSLTWDDADLRVQASTGWEALGFTLAGGADLLGSDHPDVVLGAPGWGSADDNLGAVLVFPGPLDTSSTLDSLDATAILVGGGPGGLAGRSLALLPNHGGDGATWLAVGSAPWDPTSGATGVVFLVEEVPDGTTTVPTDFVLGDAEEGAVFGFAMDGGADANGDGRADLLVGAPGTADLAGEARLFLGPISSWGGVGQAAAVYSGLSAGALAGVQVALCPDVDGDGMADVLIGAPGEAGLGAAALFLGPAVSSGWAEADAHYLGSSAGDGVGAVAAAGDTDGDGYGDYLVGAPGYAGHGEVWLLLGSSYPAASLSGAAASVEGQQSGDHLGASVATAGDFDGDGLADIAIGAPDVGDPWQDVGRALLLYGPVSGQMDMADADVTIQGAEALARAGTTVGTAGDLDRDGFSDLLVGAVSAQGLGEVALFFGQGW